MISATLYSDPACPWAYSESPALRVIEWRYGDQLDWRLVLVGLTEEASQYERRGYTPVRGVLGQARFRERYGMPFSTQVKPRLSATSRACRTVVATRMQHPGSEWRVFRAIQFANFNSPMLLDDDAHLAEALRIVPGIDPDQIVAQIDALDVVEAYDILVTNLDPTLHREPPPDTPAPLLERFPDGLTTQEVAALLTHGNDKPDRAAAEAALLELVAAGAALRHPLGADAVWQSATAGEAMDFAARYAVAVG